jgi:hypothetical protein
MPHPVRPSASFQKLDVGEGAVTTHVRDDP